MNGHKEAQQICRWLLDACGLTYRELAWLLDVSYKTAYDIVTRDEGRYRVSGDTLLALRKLKEQFETAMAGGVFDPSLLPPSRRPGANRERRELILPVIQ